MKKKLLAFLLLASTVMGYGYEKKAYELVLNLKDGSKITYLLDKKVMMTYGQSTITLTSEEIEAVYELENISSFDQVELEPDPEALEHVSASNTPDEVVIYTLEGKVVRRIATNEEREASFLLNDLQQGTYVITNGVTTYKLMKK